MAEQVQSAFKLVYLKGKDQHCLSMSTCFVAKVASLKSQSRLVTVGTELCCSLVKFLYTEVILKN